MLLKKLQLKKVLKRKKLRIAKLLAGLVCRSICDEPVKKCLAGFFDVVIVAVPDIEGRVLEGASKTEGDWPRKWSVFDNLGEILGGLFWSLATR